MRLVWTRGATLSREAIFDYIEADNPEAALAMDALFSQCALRLLEHPLMGRSGRVAHTRELVAHPNYVLVYDICADTIRILALLHAARQWPLGT